MDPRLAARAQLAEAQAAPQIARGGTAASGSGGAGGHGAASRARGAERTHRSAGRGIKATPLPAEGNSGSGADDSGGQEEGTAPGSASGSGGALRTPARALPGLAARQRRAAAAAAQTRIAAQQAHEDGPMPSDSGGSASGDSEGGGREGMRGGIAPTAGTGSHGAVWHCKVSGMLPRRLRALTSAWAGRSPCDIASRPAHAAALLVLACMRSSPDRTSMRTAASLQRPRLTMHGPAPPPAPACRTHTSVKPAAA